MSEEKLFQANIEDWIAGTKFLESNDSYEVSMARTEAGKSPFDALARITLAKALATQYRFAEAIDEYSYAISLNPNIREAYRIRGAYYLCSMRFAEALADFAVCDKLFSPAPDALYRMGVCWYLQEEYEKAAHYFEKSLESATEGDQIIGSIDWIWMCYMLAGKQELAENVLLKIPEDLVVGHHTDYVLRTDLYRGRLTVPQALDACKDKPRAEYISSLYGIMIYCRVNGEQELAKKLFDEILAERKWQITFVFIAAYCENMRKSKIE